MRQTGESEAGKAKVCAICQRDTELVADHCHATSTWRGWLCRGCNLGLGWFLDDAVTLRAAADYIEQHNANPINTLVFTSNEIKRCRPRMRERTSARAARSRQSGPGLCVLDPGLEVGAASGPLIVCEGATRVGDSAGTGST